MEKNKEVFPDVLLGCDHNLERRFIWPTPEIEGRNTKPRLVSGQVTRLICPHGCADILVPVDSKVRRYKQVLRKKASKNAN